MTVRPLLSIEQVGELLGVPAKTLYQWRAQGYGPLSFRVGRFLRYHPEDVETWVREQRAYEASRR